VIVQPRGGVTRSISPSGCKSCLSASAAAPFAGRHHHLFFDDGRAAHSFKKIDRLLERRTIAVVRAEGRSSIRLWIPRCSVWHAPRAPSVPRASRI
jgi:hypothetical protein